MVKTSLDNCQLLIKTDNLCTQELQANVLVKQEEQVPTNRSIKMSIQKSNQFKVVITEEDKQNQFLLLQINKFKKLKTRKTFNN